MGIDVLTLPIPKTMSVSLEMLICCSPGIASFHHKYPGTSYLFRKVDSSFTRRSHMAIPAAATNFAVTFAITCQSPVTALEVPET